MMTVPDSFPETEIDYKQKYKALKKRLKLLVYEQECFLEELRKAQRKLLKVAKDRSFLLDRLIQYEKVEDSSGDSEATASSDSDAEGHHRDGIPAKRKRVTGHGGGASHSQASASGEGGSQQATPSSITSIILAQQQAAAGGTQEGGKKRAKTSNKKAKTGTPKTSSQPTVTSILPTSTIPGQMTREELERHLDSKQNVFGIEKATASLPMDIFSNDNSNNACDPTGNGGTGDDDEEDLVIDIPH